MHVFYNRFDVAYAMTIVCCWFSLLKLAIFIRHSCKVDKMRLRRKFVKWCPFVNMFRGRKRRTCVYLLIFVALAVHLWWHIQLDPSEFCSVNDDPGESTRLDCANISSRPVVGCSVKDHKVIYKDDARVLGTGLKHKVHLTIGLPTIKRTYKNQTASYLEETLDSLLAKLSPDDMTQVHIVIFLADLEETSRQNIKQTILSKYKKFIDNNLINVIQAPREFYPKLKGLARTFGDSQERMYWRSKQTMDYVYLFNYCDGLSKYYIHMEDDVTIPGDFMPTVNRCIDLFKDEEWSFIKTSIWGFIGKLFKNEELDYFARMLRIFYNDIPCDWLLHKYPTWRGDYATVADRICGHIFKHIGYQSSSLGT